MKSRLLFAILIFLCYFSWGQKENIYWRGEFVNKSDWENSEDIIIRKDNKEDTVLIIGKFYNTLYCISKNGKKKRYRAPKIKSGFWKKEERSFIALVISDIGLLGIPHKVLFTIIDNGQIQVLSVQAQKSDFMSNNNNSPTGYYSNDVYYARNVNYKDGKPLKLGGFWRKNLKKLGNDCPNFVEYIDNCKWWSGSVDNMRNHVRKYHVICSD